VQVVQRVLLQVELLLPLVRVALTCMSVDSLQLVQAQAIGEMQARVVVGRQTGSARDAASDNATCTAMSKASNLVPLLLLHLCLQPWRCLCSARIRSSAAASLTRCCPPCSATCTPLAPPSRRRACLRPRGLRCSRCPS
jgi:hypothetical protein